ncbi:SIR2 family protein [Moorellaceae bacterium AZ2]
MVSKPTENTRYKFDKLIKFLLQGKVIPFLGAGISNDAEYRNAESDSSVRPTVQNWKTVILNKIKEKDTHRNEEHNSWLDWCWKSSQCHPNTRRICNNHSCRSSTEGFSQSECNLINNISLAQLCEMYLWLCGGQAHGYDPLIKEVLKIHTLVDLQPTPAHRYIAYLAREGLIDEVITTNYDTCMELAYSHTFKENRPDAAQVIVDLKDYRNKSGVVRQEDSGKWYRCLKIYKINGCARKLKLEEAKAATILLTEKQLQDWRERHWARDLFRDRLRSRTILFSGFGSNEPQVRHTALQVVEEFQIEEKNNSSSDQENALFIAAYEKYLSFTQMQILYAYLQAYADNQSALPFETVHQNVFCGADYPFFADDTNSDSEAEKEYTLDKNLFWKRVFQATFCKLLREYCRKGSVAVAYLSALIPCAETLLQEMVEWFAPEERPFGRFPQLLEITSGGVLPLSRWVWCVRYGEAGPPAGWYAPLAERPVLIPLILLTVFLSLDEDETCLPWSELEKKVFTSKGFFALEMKFSTRGEKIKFLVAHHDKVFQSQETVELPDELFEDRRPASLVQILISNSAIIRAQRKKIRVPSCNTGQVVNRIRIVSVYEIPLRDLFRQENVFRLQQAPKVKKFFRELLLKVILEVDRVCPRIKDRAIPLRRD